MGQQPLRIALVEDNKDIARSIQGLVDAEPDMRMVTVFPNAEEFLAAFMRTDIDVVLMDLNLPGKSGIDAMREAKPQKPFVQFMVLTVYESPAYVFEALCAGATGYLVKGHAPEELASAVRDLHAGGSPMSSAIARLVVGSFQKETLQRIADDQLTERERSVLDQLANGLLYKEIAAKWDISIETVRKHARNIYAKLQVRSRTEAIRKVYPDR
ncbi:MAG: response regulator transcription factor [Flavobacteriales bacterium]|nr:response regulator transcription factor [Flavobacteriales bacterium]